MQVCICIGTYMYTATLLGQTLFERTAQVSYFSLTLTRIHTLSLSLCLPVTFVPGTHMGLPAPLPRIPVLAPNELGCIDM